jgi:hypothetical protein
MYCIEFSHDLRSAMPEYALQKLVKLGVVWRKLGGHAVSLSGLRRDQNRIDRIESKR